MKNIRYYRYLRFYEDDAYSDEKVETRHDVSRVLHQLVQVRHLHIKRDSQRKIGYPEAIGPPGSGSVGQSYGSPDPNP